jgi:hypothetical protein
VISDVLADAVAEIDDYLADSRFDIAYEGELRARIVRVRDEMEAMSAELGRAPTREAQEA